VKLAAHPSSPPPLDHVAAIVRTRLARNVVVVSAMGKTAIACSRSRGYRRSYRRVGAAKSLRAYTLLEGSAAVEPIFQELAELVQGLAVLGELTPRSIDAISAYGERISSVIVAERFRANGLDAVQADSREYIVTDGRHTQAAPLYPETYERLRTRLVPIAQQRLVVMGGFIGSTLNGVTTTLGRGGSDFSASIIGAGIEAEEIQIWTDVDGMLTCDPRIADIGHRVKAISFGEAAELAYFGAKVLHPSTVLPAVEKNIPVFILNSRRPEVEGTRIVAETVPCTNPFKAIACKQGIFSVHIRSTRMLMAHGFLRRIFEVFDHGDARGYSRPREASVSLTIDNAQRLDSILAEIREFAEASVETDQAIICMVGDNIGTTHGIAGRVFQAMNGTNIRMISQGASSLNLSFVVASRDLAKGVIALHREFFSELDPRIFERRAAA
jgi:aspartate kinase